MMSAGCAVGTTSTVSGVYGDGVVVTIFTDRL